MRFIPTRTHGVLDYVIGILLLVLPPLLGFAGPLAWLPLLLGAGLILYSLVTDYEFAVLRVMPVRIHLVLDMLGGVLAIACGLALGTSPREWLTLLVIGVIEITSGLTTRTATSEGAGLERSSVLPSPEGPTLGMPGAAAPRTADRRPSPPSEVRNVEQERRAIDSGATEEKVAVTDPAAAPLGADAEAAEGPNPAGLAIARRSAPRSP